MHLRKALIVATVASMLTGTASAAPGTYGTEAPPAQRR
jgi:hypothetical protein